MSSKSQAVSCIIEDTLVANSLMANRPNDGTRRNLDESSLVLPQAVEKKLTWH